MSDNVTVVTGGGSGIGREICLQLASADCAVAVLDMNGESAQAVAAEADDIGCRSFALVCDLARCEWRWPRWWASSVRRVYCST